MSREVPIRGASDFGLGYKYLRDRAAELGEEAAAILPEDLGVAAERAGMADSPFLALLRYAITHKGDAQPIGIMCERLISDLIAQTDITKITDADVTEIEFRIQHPDIIFPDVESDGTPYYVTGEHLEGGGGEGGAHG